MTCSRHIDVIFQLVHWVSVLRSHIPWMQRSFPWTLRNWIFAWEIFFIGFSSILLLGRTIPQDLSIPLAFWVRLVTMHIYSRCRLSTFFSKSQGVRKWVHLELEPITLVPSPKGEKWAWSFNRRWTGFGSFWNTPRNYVCRRELWRVWRLLNVLVD